jgi:hypothetical protein
MAPPDKTSYKIPTRAAKKLAQPKPDLPNPLAQRRHSAFVMERTRRATVLVEQVIDSVYPLSAPGARDSHAMFKQFSLDPRGLDLTEAQWRAMDWSERLENSRDWLKTHAERVRKARSALSAALPGRPIEPKTRSICRMFLDWCRDHNVDPKKPVQNKCLAEISPKFYPEEWEQYSDKRAHNKIQEKVRSRIEAARDSLWWEFWEYELFFRSS